MRGRKKIVVDNQAVMEYLWQFGEINEPLEYAVPRWVDDCVSGVRCYGGSRPSTCNILLFALSQLPVLTYETVAGFVNRKTIAMGESRWSQAHSYAFFKRLCMANKAILYHYESKTGTRLIPHI